MASLRDIKSLAKKLGAKVEDGIIGQSHDCSVEAPHGKRWSCDSIHELIDAAYRPWKPDYDDLLARMNYGLEDCTDPNCEWCQSISKSF